MKTIKLIVAILVFCSMSVNAQIVDTFDSNKFGWTEISGIDGDAIIKEGKMFMECKADGYIETHCYAPIDFTKDFEIKCDALVKKVNDKNIFGMLLNYLDDGNYIAFVLTEGKAELYRYEHYKLIGRIRADIKLKSQKKANLQLKIKSTFQKLEFFVNDMKALECRYLPLTSSGMGFYICGKQTINFDNFEILQ